VVNSLERKQLKKIRSSHNMTLQQVADELGVSKPYYWQIENGERGLSYELAVKIAAVFKKKPDEIFLDNELTNEEHSA
jgi:putative transcriptional regulator